MSGQPVQKSRRRRVLRMIGLYVLLPYLAIVVIFTAMQRKLIYQPTAAASLRVADVGLDDKTMSDRQIRTPDGVTLNGWLIKAATEPDGDESAPLVIYFPGNAVHRYARRHDLLEVASYGFDVLIFDYRGYGDNEGSPSESALTADARLIWDFARDELGYAGNRIVVFGESLGGGVALSLWSGDPADDPQPAAVVLNSTFSSLTDTVRGMYPLFPFQYLLLDRWESKERIRRVRCPIVAFHGTADELIPVEQTQILSQAAAGNLQVFKIQGAGHNNLPIQNLRRELERLREVIMADDEEALF